MRAAKATRDPPDRTSAFGAKAAADVGRHHAHPRLVAAETVAERRSRPRAAPASMSTGRAVARSRRGRRPRRRGIPSNGCRRDARRGFRERRARRRRTLRRHRRTRPRSRRAGWRSRCDVRAAARRRGRDAASATAAQRCRSRRSTSAAASSAKARSVGEDHRDRLADVAHLVACEAAGDRLLAISGLQRHARHGRGEMRRRDPPAVRPHDTPGIASAADGSMLMDARHGHTGCAQTRRAACPDRRDRRQSGRRRAEQRGVLDARDRRCRHSPTRGAMRHIAPAGFGVGAAPRARRRRCPDSRCSGRDCPRAPRGPLARVGVGLVAQECYAASSACPACRSRIARVIARRTPAAAA